MGSTWEDLDPDNLPPQSEEARQRLLLGHRERWATGPSTEHPLDQLLDAWTDYIAGGRPRLTGYGVLHDPITDDEQHPLSFENLDELP